MAAIDVGPEAIDRASSSTAGYTDIQLTNPANLTGSITSVEIWASTNLTGCKVGIFYLVSGTTYKCRSAATIGNVTAGSKQTFSGLSLAVVTGDFIGIYWVSGYMEADTSGYDGFLWRDGDHCVVNDSASYTLLSGDALSIKGLGVTPVVALSAVSAGVCSVSAAIAVAHSLSAVSAGVASVSGALKVAHSLAALSQGVCSVTANLTNTKWLRAVIAGEATVSGFLRVARALSAVSAGVATVSGAIRVLRGLSATITCSSTVTASLFHVRKAVRTLDAVRNLLAVRNIPPVR